MAPGRGGSHGRRFVIVGAGTAGCVLAARLSEDPTHHVTLLEAGPDLTATTTPPEIAGADALAALGVADRFWSDVVAARVEGRQSAAYPRGRGVGGSSVVNGMLATLGPQALYDDWAAHGCDGWSASDLTSALARLALPRRVATDAELGPVDRALLGAVPASRSTRPVGGSAVTGSAVTGSAVTGFDDTVLGARPVALTRDESGRRVSVVDAYLDPARGRANLEVRSDTSVGRVLCDDGRAVGVELATGETLDADEVVVSAGAIHTPLLLAASGVGIPGVGVGIQDHPAVTFTLRLRDPAVAGALAMGVTAAMSSTDDDGTADLQLLAINRVDDHHGALVLALMDVHSRGRVDCNGGSDGARVHFAQLSDERDLTALTRGVLTVARWLRSGAVDAVAEQVLIDDRGTPLDALAEDHDAIARWLLDHVDGHHHASSSCRMGPADDPSSVVDPRLRVRGVEGLSVCDASVFPRVPTVNVHLPVVLVAERAAQFLAG